MPIPVTVNAGESVERTVMELLLALEKAGIIELVGTYADKLRGPDAAVAIGGATIKLHPDPHA